MTIGHLFMHTEHCVIQNLCYLRGDTRRAFVRRSVPVITFRNIFVTNLSGDANAIIAHEQVISRV